MKLIKRVYRVTKENDASIKKVSRKLRISQSEVVRRRTASWQDMLHELSEDMKHAPFIKRKNLLT